MEAAGRRRVRDSKASWSAPTPARLFSSVRRVWAQELPWSPLTSESGAPFSRACLHGSSSALLSTSLRAYVRSHFCLQAHRTKDTPVLSFLFITYLTISSTLLRCTAILMSHHCCLNSTPLLLASISPPESTSPHRWSLLAPSLSASSSAHSLCSVPDDPLFLALWLSR